MMGGRGRARWRFFLFCMASVLVMGTGCRKEECPPGTIRYGDTCKAAPDDVISPADISFPDLGQDPEVRQDAEETISDSITADEETESPASDAPHDPGSAEVFPGGVIGKPCQTSQQCRNENWNGSCLSWNKGYCAVKGCGEGLTCPEGALCMGVALDQPTCVKACLGDGDCREKDGYACKLLPDPDGNLAWICHELDSEGEPGYGCGTPSDCGGTQGCLSQFPGGYCAQWDCGPELPCPEKARCVRLSGRPVCLRACETSEDCRVPGELPRACLSLRDSVTGDRVGVCGSAVTGGPIGAQCLNETECASEVCRVTVLGLCSSTGRGCVTDRDCLAAEVCKSSSEVAAGFCTAKCSTAAPCPGQSLCVETLQGDLDAVEGWCVSGCSQDNPCRQEAGLECRYGDPLISPGRYACVRMPAGDPGSRCTGNEDCRHRRCLKAPEAPSGYCTVPCSSLYNGRCPFPTACGTWQNESLCLHRCRSNTDCPVGSRCDTDAPLPVCVPSPG